MVFLLKFKMGHKAVETTHNVNNALCPGTANKNIHALHYSAVVVQEILQRRWEPWKWEAQWLATRSWQWPTEWIIKADPLTTSQEIAEELNANPSKWWTTYIWSKLERWKNSISGCLMSWPQLKSSSFWSVISYSMQQWTISWSDLIVTWGKKWILCNNQQWLDCSSVVGPKSSKALLKTKPVPKRPGTLFDGVLPVWSTTAFWILTKPLHLRRILSSRLMRCAKNCTTYSQHWLTERTQFFSTPMSNQTSNNQCFKKLMNWASKFCLICHFHLTSCQPISTSSSIPTFCRENASTTNRMQKMLSKSQIFMLQD